MTTHDGSAQGGKKIARGNKWTVAGIVVRLPFCTAPVCLPVLFRLWAGKGTTSSVGLASELLTVIAAASPDRRVHGVGDAAYHGPALLVPDTTLPQWGGHWLAENLAENEVAEPDCHDGE